MKVCFPYRGIPPLEIPESAPVSLLEPKILPEHKGREIDIIREGMRSPIGLPRIKEEAKGKKNALIIVDDYTRSTPAHLIIPEVFEELYSAGINKENIKFLIASGTHRPMTRKEKVKKLGHHIVNNYSVLDHRYNDPGELTRLPATNIGIEIRVNRILMESSYIIGIGQIVPHRVAGFSGGGKIIQPGVCGEITTGQVHWFSAQFPGAEIMGSVDNPVRKEIEEVAKAAGLDFIINVVLDGSENTVQCFCGDPGKAFRLGAKKSMEIFGVPLPETADIVITDSHPGDSNLWQAAKGIYAADLALKPDGIVILVTTCPEGVCREHPGILDIGYRSFEEVKSMVERGEIRDLTMAAHLVHVGRVISGKRTGILISTGIERRTAVKIGFQWAATPQEALTYALKQKGSNASIVIIKNGGEVMPLVRSIENER